MELLNVTKIPFSNSDTAWLAANQPAIAIDHASGDLLGKLFLDRAFEGNTLTGEFDLRIQLRHNGNSRLPKVFEIGGYIDSLSKKLRVNSTDLHRNKSDSSLCLCIYERELEYFKSSPNIPEFLESYVEPYFYWLRYFEIFKKPPWSDYSHGYLGQIELYLEGIISANYLAGVLSKESSVPKNLNAIKGHHNCICGSQKKIRSCHPRVFFGLHKFMIEGKANG